MSNNDFTEDMIRTMLSQMGSVPIIFSVESELPDRPIRSSVSQAELSNRIEQFSVSQAELPDRLHDSQYRRAELPDLLHNSQYGVDIADENDDVEIITVDSDEESLIDKSEELIDNFSEESENEMTKPDSVNEGQPNDILPKSGILKKDFLMDSPKQININDLINMIPLLGKQENLFANIPSTQNKPVKKKIIEEFNKNNSKEEFNDDDKIILNVGGKKFNIKREWLDLLHINNKKLHRINQDGKTIYFLDRDPSYFSQIIDVIKDCDFDDEKMVNNLNDYSDQLIYELCTYKLIDDKYKPNPKIKLKTYVGFVNESRHNVIIKIIIQNQTFETFSSTLCKSPFFEKKLKMNRSNKITLNDIDPKIFRHVLNVLRMGQICVYSSLITSLLNNYGIDHLVINEKKIPSQIVSSHIHHPNQIITNKLIEFANRNNIDPSNLSLNMYQTITTESKLSFGSNLLFNLSGIDTAKNIYVCIDIPILKPTEQYSYVDLLEYTLIENAVIIYIVDGKQKFLTINIPDHMYLQSIIYKHNPDSYHQLAKNIEKKIKVLHNDNLIDIHRLTLPIFDFTDPLPIKKMIDLGMNPQINIKIVPLAKIFKDTLKEIPLLNASLLVNNMSCSLKKSYLCDRLHAINIPVQKTDHPVYDMAIISLDKMGLIQDFYFTIITKEDHIANKINKFSDFLVELEIVRGNPPVTVICVMDTDILNGYGPLEKLGHVLPPGIYYHSFCCQKSFGGLVGQDHLLRIKVKKQSEIVRLYINEIYSLF